MTKLLEEVISEASKLPPAEQEKVARQWLHDLRSRDEKRQLAVDRLMQVIDEAAAEARPEPGWRFSREETYRERLDRYQ